MSADCKYLPGIFLFELFEYFLILKVALLLEFILLKRVGDLQTLSVAPFCLNVACVLAKVIMHSRPDYADADSHTNAFP